MFPSALRAVLLCFTAIGVLSADLISTNGHNWDNSWNANRNGEYWDQDSDDEPAALSGNDPGCNIGFYIRGLAATNCTNQQGANTFNTGPGVRNMPFLEASLPGGNDLGFSFTSVTSPHFTIQLMAEAAGRRNLQEFGLYFLGPGAPANLKLISGPDAPLLTRQFSPGNYSFGFYFKIARTTGPPGLFDLFYSQPDRAGQTDPGNQHFALFRQQITGVKTTYWIGMENTNSANADNDYNDMLVKIACLQCGAGARNGAPMFTPEPGTLGVAGVALIALATWQLRARKRYTRQT